MLEPALREAGVVLTEDRFGGVELSFGGNASKDGGSGSTGVAADIPWDAALPACLAAWRREKKYRGVWLRLNPQTNPLAGLVLQAAVDAGFQMHAVDGARPNAEIVLKIWLPEDTPTALPDAPHHQLGIAGMVVNARDEVLVIRERRGPTAALEGFWKLPGGLVDPGEDMAVAVVREVMEETGVAVTFDSLVAFRESHKGPFGSTDIYAVCAMRLADPALYCGHAPLPQPVSPHPGEIKAVAWMPVDDFLGSKYYKRGLYGALLRTAAGPARAVAAAAAATATGNGAPAETSSLAEITISGLREKKMFSVPGREESLFFIGQAKL